MKVVHKASKSNPADYLSRHPDLTNGAACAENSAEEEAYINFIAQSCVPKAMNLEDIANTTDLDAVLQRVIFILLRGHWTIVEKKDGKLLSYFLIRHELSVTGCPQVLLKGCKLIILASLQAQVLKHWVHKSPAS